MSPQLTTFLYEAANFCVFAVALGWLFFKPVRKALAAHRQAVAAEADEARQKLADAARAQQALADQRRALASELEAMRRDIEAKARQQAEAIVAAARTDAEHARQAVKQQALSLQEAQKTQLAQVMTQVAAQIVCKLLAQINGPALQDALCQAACGALEPWNGQGLGQVTVESPGGLSAEHEAALRAALGEAGPGARFITAPRLIVGLRVVTDRGLVDQSGAGLASLAQRTLDEALVKLMQEQSGREEPTQEQSGRDEQH